MKSLLRLSSQLPSLLGATGSLVSTLGRRSIYQWSVERDPHPLPKASDIIDEAKIHHFMESTKERAKDPEVIKDILATALDRALLTEISFDECRHEFVQGLDLEQAATLLNVDAENEELMDALFQTAVSIKQRIYGNRIVLFAPLYLANYCINDCLYCAFRKKSKAPRSHLSDDAIREEVGVLQQMGHRRLLLLTGESRKYTFDDFLRAIDIVSSTTTDPCGSIRRINVEIPPISISDFKRLKETNQIGTYTVFQETYHRDSYEQYHTSGPKANYDHRLLTMDRAQIGGIDDVGIGALFGLYDYRFEVLALLMHASHLEQNYGAGPHTISIPRIRPALDSDVSEKPPHVVDDANFKKLVAVLRCAVPYTGMILSTRESTQMRRQLLDCGISQMSAGSKTDVGSYHRGAPKECEGCASAPEPVPEEDGEGSQFSLLDHRNLDEVVKDLMTDGYVPSWCTACYRMGRTGEAFMRIAKKGDIHMFCHPNALLTLEEYLQDYATEDTADIGRKVIEKERETLRVTNAFDKKMEKVRAGEHDLYF